MLYLGGLSSKHAQHLFAMAHSYKPSSRTLRSPGLAHFVEHQFDCSDISSENEGDEDAPSAPELSTALLVALTCTIGG